MPNIGINITEVVDQGSPLLAGDNELFPGFLIVSQRGPANRPLVVTSMNQFKKLFGSHFASGFGAYVVDGYFTNGGRKSLINRIVGVGALASLVTLVDRASTPLNTLKVEAGYKGDVDKGVWGDSLSVVITNNANDATLFDLEVRLSGVTKEMWRGLTPATAVTSINDATMGSEYIKVTNLSSASVAPTNNPALGTFTLDNGADGSAPIATAFTGTQADFTGLYAFDAFDISHLANAESTDSTHLGALRDYCSSRGTVFGIAAIPIASTVSSAETAGTNLQVSNAYMALYGGWVSIIDPIGSGPNPLKWVPPVGHVLGVYARTFRDRGVHKAPAGVIDGQLKGVFDLDMDINNDTDLTDLANVGVNAIRAVPGYGRVVAVSRTLSKDIRWRFVNVRNLFNYVKRSLKTGLAFVQQEPNDAILRSKVRNNVVLPFFRNLFMKGAFGSGKFEDLVTITCDESNNPPSEIDLGNFHIDITMYPGKPAETILISVAQQVTGASAVNEQ